MKIKEFIRMQNDTNYVIYLQKGKQRFFYDPTNTPELNLQTPTDVCLMSDYKTHPVTAAEKQEFDETDIERFNIYGAGREIDFAEIEINPPERTF